MAARQQRADGQEVVAHVREAVAVVLLGVVVHQLEAQQRAQVAVGAAVPVVAEMRSTAASKLRQNRNTLLQRAYKGWPTVSPCAPVILQRT